MPHQSVKVVWAGSARIDLIVDDFRLLTEVLPQHLRHVGCLLQRRPVRHVNDHLELALVVEGQHLQVHPLQRNECHRREQQQHDAAHKHPAPSGIQDERGHHPAIETRRPALGLVLGIGTTLAYFRSSLSAAQGDTTKATIRENNMAAEAPIGIGRM